MKINAVLPALPEAAAKQKGEPKDKTLGLGAVLRQVREHRGVTQEQLATAVGLKRTSITNYERGTQRLQLSTLAMIADALDMELVVHLKPRQQ